MVFEIFFCVIYFAVIYTFPKSSPSVVEKNPQEKHLKRGHYSVVFFHWQKLCQWGYTSNWMPRWTSNRLPILLILFGKKLLKGVQMCPRETYCLALYIPELTWLYLNLPELIWICMNLPEFDWIWLDLPEFTWIYLKLPEITWIYHNLP